MPPGSRAFTGAVRDKPDPRDYIVDFSTTSASSLLTSIGPNGYNIYDGPIAMEQSDGTVRQVPSPFKLHVFDQFENTSTCVPCAVGIAYKCYTERQKTGDEGLIPSRLFLYYVVRLMRTTNLKLLHQPKAGQKDSDYLASLANDPPHMEEQIADDDGSSPRDVCKVLKHLGCVEEKSMYESGAGYPERDMWEPGWKPDATGFIDGKPWWPYFEVDPIPTGRKLEPYFGDFWWKGYNARAETFKDEHGEEYYVFPSGALGRKPPSGTAFASAKNHQALAFSHPGGDNTPDNVLSWKSALVYGWPIVFMFYNQASTYNDDNGELKKNGYVASALPEVGDDLTNNLHCVLAVGYDDQKKCFKIQDSYGSASFDEGFWWMPYSWLELTLSNGKPMIYHGDVWVLHG